MIKVGLTGGIGSGKSTLSRYLKEKGIPIIDADRISREVLIKYDEILKKIKEKFGEQYIDEEGKLKRKELGKLVFENENSRKELEKIMIPYIIKEIFNTIEVYRENKEKICILDAPTLIENNLQTYMDYNILVWANEEEVIKRVISRDLLTNDEVASRIKAQMPLEDKKKYVDYIIDNSKAVEDSYKQLDMIIDRLIDGESE